MQKFILFSLIVLILISCTNKPIEPEKRQISFGIGTKSIATPVDTFGVYAHWGTTYIMENARYDADGNPVSNTYYWPNTECSELFSFVAYSPFSPDVYRTGNEITLSVNGFSVNNDDVAYARTTTQKVIDRVPLNFNHVLSNIVFSGKYDPDIIDSIEIVSIKFGSPLNTSGNLTINLSGNDVSWSNIGGLTDVEFSRQNRNLSGVDYVDVSDVFVIPQSAPTSMTVIFNVRMISPDGEEAIVYNGKKITKSISEIPEFRAGRRYAFQFYVTSDDVEFGISDDDWTNLNKEWMVWTHVDSAYAEHHYKVGYASNGTPFMNGVSGIDFSNGDYFEAKMDLRRMNRAKQNIVSIGENIANWSPSGSVEKLNFHVYFPNDVGDKRVRFSVVSNNKVGNNNRRTMGIVKTSVFDYDANDNYMLTIKFDKNGFYVNGHLITRNDFDPVEASKTPEWPKNPSGVYPDVYTYPEYFMPHFQGVLNLEFGSMEGSTRSYADYEYIKYHHNL